MVVLRLSLFGIIEAVVLLQSAITASSSNSIITQCETEGSPSFDYYLFVQRHPDGYCVADDFCDECVVQPHYKSWTIHGLWPSIRGVMGPNYCGEEGETVFDLFLLRGLIRDLLVSWPSVCKDYGGPVSFWEHEWCKHGTCARNESILDTQYKYFDVSLTLSRVYDFEEILQAHGIVPSSSIGYESKRFNTAFKNSIGVRPFIECSTQAAEGKQILHQITICLDKSLAAVNCDPSTYIRDTACPRDEKIYYI